MTEMKADIISREIIKPSSSTPPSLRKLSLSLADQASPSTYVPLIFFYKTQDLHQIPQRSLLLKKSLSETLALFYPLAGRVKDNSFIDCNDDGAYFLEARINCQLSDILQQPQSHLLYHFLPEEYIEDSVAKNCMLLVQFSIFDCGGTAICIESSHKINDVSSISTFLKSWTTAASGLHQPLRHEFIGASLLPSVDGFIQPNEMGLKYPTRRYVFGGSQIQRLKSKVIATTGMQPTRVEVVLGFIFKCLTMLKSDSSGPSWLSNAVNIRKRMMPPLSEHSIGNLVWGFPISVHESERELEVIVEKLRKGLQDFNSNTVNRLKGEEGLLMMGESYKRREKKIFPMDSYSCSSWCGFGFYELDFGWGKPAWVTTAYDKIKNLILLLEANTGDGIQALITLDEQNMEIFECNEQILEYASFNPSAYIDASEQSKIEFEGPTFESSSNGHNF